MGSPSDVEAIRRRARGPFVYDVQVVGNFAHSTFGGAGEGQALYKRTASGWSVVTAGGGALDSNAMRSYGIPERAWCAFGAYDLRCPTRR